MERRAALPCGIPSPLMKLARPRSGQSQRGLTLLEMTIVILVLLSMVTILMIGARAWRKGTDRAGCLINIRNVQQAVRSKQNLASLPDGAPIHVVGEVIGNGMLIETLPSCPGSGWYTYAETIPAKGEMAITCSLDEEDNHVMEHHEGW